MLERGFLDVLSSVAQDVRFLLCTEVPYERVCVRYIYFPWVCTENKCSAIMF